MTLFPPSLAGYEETLMRLAAILAKHFADSRIVGTGKAAFLCFGVIMSQVWPVPLPMAHQASDGICLLNLLSACASTFKVRLSIVLILLIAGVDA